MKIIFNGTALFFPSVHYVVPSTIWLRAGLVKLTLNSLNLLKKKIRDSRIFSSDFDLRYLPNETTHVESEHTIVLLAKFRHNKLPSKICADARGGS